MVLTDYFRSEHDITWDYALQCGVKHGVIRLPETSDFDISNKTHWKEVYDRFINFGITPIVIEPMPNSLHDHIKIGDNQRDWAIEQVIKMLPIMDELNIRTICFNWMAHIGWLRTSECIRERGNALVTGFNVDEFVPTDKSIAEKQLWDNYEYFIKSVIPYAEKYNIRFALHPDDPPVEKLGNVSRIIISYENIKRAVFDIVESNFLGVTMCQATYHMMGENLYTVIPELKDKIFFIHFRNAKGNKFSFNETFHDNGSLNMAQLCKLYCDNGIDVPIRVDHVPLMAGENQELAGYTALGRLFAIGYLKGLLDVYDK